MALHTLLFIQVTLLKIRGLQKWHKSLREIVGKKNLSMRERGRETVMGAQSKYIMCMNEILREKKSNSISHRKSLMNIRFGTQRKKQMNIRRMIF